MHLGDSVIFLSALFLGAGAIPAAAIGSLLADVFLGYAVFAPFTLVIKGALALVSWLILRRFEMGRKGLFRALCIVSLAAFFVVVGGYFFAEAILTGSFAAAAVSIFMNVLQVFFSAVLATVVCLSLGMDKIERIKKEILRF